jgi:hypothetical protein
MGETLRERLGAQVYAHEHSAGAALSDDDVARLARAVAAELRAAPVG